MGGDWLTRNRARIYLLANAAVMLALIMDAGSPSASFGLVLYVATLFALCTMPIIWLERLNDRYSLLAMFMGIYFLIFGALDLQVIVTGSDPAVERGGFMTLAQIAVLIGAVFTLAGYVWGVRWAASSKRQSEPTDWSYGAILAVGLGCWIAGSAATAYYALYVVPENTAQATQHGLAAMGPLLTFAVMLGQMIQPLGVVILAYGYARFRSSFWFLLVVLVVALQVVLGFITDTKGTALFGFLLVAVTKTLWDGKVSKAWVIGIVVFATLMFPVLQANRIMRTDRGLNRQQALENVWKMLEASFEARDKIYETHGGRRAQTFLERSSGEGAIEILFQHAGVDTPLLQGRTLIAVPYAFVPRLILPDKEDVQVGELYNQTFLHGSKDDFTYISVSHLGEFYWNFGWPGVVFGSLLTGWLFGMVGARCSLADVQSLTRLLVLLVTIKTLCLGYGGSISMSYVVWMRCMAGVGLLHLIFSGPSTAKAPSVAASDRTALLQVEPAMRFPNLMR
jgi:hypothetical protein